MRCIAPVRIFNNLNPSEYPDGLLVPCGKCIACKVGRRDEWALRMTHELQSWQGIACFITLTYDDDNLPEGGTLKKKDLQNYFKRLRKNIYPLKIKYFACGEYGGETYRPHYHAIIFGLFNDLESKDQIKIAWGKGLIDVGTAEPNSINYVAKYIDKQLSDTLEDEFYTQHGLEAPFRLSSNGLGLTWLIDNKDQLIHFECISHNGIEKALPRYYLKKLGLEKSEFRKKKAYEQEKKYIEKISGIECDDIQLYSSDVQDYKDYQDHLIAYRNQKKLALIASMRNSKRK